MSPVAYPWRWLTDAVGTMFTLRYPWLEALGRAAAAGERCCLLVPAVAGSLADWEDWLAERLQAGAAAPCLTAAGHFVEVARALSSAYQLEDTAATDGRAEAWAQRFLPACRRRMPHVEPVPLLVTDADDTCAAGLADLSAAQRALGYCLVRPIVLRRTAPPGWELDCVRLGLPQPGGDLHGITPLPERDLAAWTDLLLALTVAWEVGAAPPAATELWEQLQVGRSLSLRDAGFDTWLGRQLQLFAQQQPRRRNGRLPESLAFGPAANVADELWQDGLVGFDGGCFDITPLHARLWITELRDEAREALRRRRLTNVPLARWLSAWATSIEESLRVAALQAGGPKFRLHLQRQPSRDRRNGSGQSRWDELAATHDVAAIDLADFGDLAGFVGQMRKNNSRAVSLAGLFEDCRLARNRVVHERNISTRDLLHITRMVDWLVEQGLL